MPRSVALVSVLLFLTGLAAAAVGVGASAVSGCCGARETGDSTAAVVGVSVGFAAIVAAVLLWTRAASRWLVLAIAAAVPVACLVAAASSADLAAVAPLAVVGWLLLAVFVSRGRAAAWLSADRGERPNV